MHPQPFAQFLYGGLAGQYAQQPSAFRAGDKLVLFPTAFSDNVPGHAGPGSFRPPLAPG